MKQTEKAVHQQGNWKIHLLVNLKSNQINVYL